MYPYRTDLLQYLVKLSQILVGRYRSLVHSPDMLAQSWGPKLCEYLETLLCYCVDICSVFIEPPSVLSSASTGSAPSSASASPGSSHSSSAAGASSPRSPRHQPLQASSPAAVAPVITDVALMTWRQRYRQWRLFSPCANHPNACTVSAVQPVTSPALPPQASRGSPLDGLGIMDVLAGKSSYQHSSKSELY